MNKIEMENRLVDFSVNVVGSIENLEKKGVNVHLKDQIIRSATACALNYGEAQSAESRKDFIHKLGIVMKELRETQINLKMLIRLNQGTADELFKSLIKENDELLAIIYRTIETTRKNN
jgi:four helix bundle protein